MTKTWRSVAGERSQKRFAYHLPILPIPRAPAYAPEGLFSQGFALVAE
jgi:hypothetical protein